MMRPGVYAFRNKNESEKKRKKDRTFGHEKLSLGKTAS